MSPSLRNSVDCDRTEYGVADLYGKSLGERARALISIAHPEDRDRLQAEWRAVCSQVK